MDRQLWMVAMGVTAIVIYSLSWVMQWMHWPGKDWVRLSALVPFLIGAGILLYDRAKKAKAQGRARKNGWEDILGEEEEEN